MDNKDKIANFTKAQLKEAVAQKDDTVAQVQRLQSMVFGLSLKIFKLEKQLEGFGVLKQAATAADYRSIALMKLLASVGISEDQVKAKVKDLQVADFELGSFEDDGNRKLLIVTNRAAQTGDTVIGAVTFYKDGQQLPDEGIIRSKIELGKKELFPESTLDEVLVGALIGESRRFPLVLAEGRTDEAEFALLGIREPAPAPVALEASPSTTPGV